MGDEDFLRRLKSAMIPHARSMQGELGKCVDNFGTYDYEVLRSRCGPEFAAVPTDDIRRMSINLRKAAKLGAVNGHGPSISEKPNKEMLAYYDTPHWRTFASAVRHWWNYRCALCNAADARDVHHRTYERLGNEELNDCVLLCRKCHKVADVRRKWQMSRGEKTLF